MCRLMCGAACIGSATPFGLDSDNQGILVTWDGVVDVLDIRCLVIGIEDGVKVNWL